MYILKDVSKFYLSCNCAKLKTFSSIEKKNYESFDVMHSNTSIMSSSNRYIV